MFVCIWNCDEWQNFENSFDIRAIVGAMEKEIKIWWTKIIECELHENDRNEAFKVLECVQFSVLNGRDSERFMLSLFLSLLLFLHS